MMRLMPASPSCMQPGSQSPLPRPISLKDTHTHNQTHMHACTMPCRLALTASGCPGGSTLQPGLLNGGLVACMAWLQHLQLPCDRLPLTIHPQPGKPCASPNALPQLAGLHVLNKQRLLECLPVFGAIHACLIELCRGGGVGEAPTGELGHGRLPPKRCPVHAHTHTCVHGCS